MKLFPSCTSGNKSQKLNAWTQTKAGIKRDLARSILQHKLNCIAMNLTGIDGSPINEKKWVSGRVGKCNCGFSLTCSHTWVAGSARGKRGGGEGGRFPTAFGMLKYCSALCYSERRGEQGSCGAHRNRACSTLLPWDEVKEEGRGCTGGISHWPKQDMCHKVEEEKEEKRWQAPAQSTRAEREKKKKKFRQTDESRVCQDWAASLFCFCFFVIRGGKERVGDSRKD